MCVACGCGMPRVCGLWPHRVLCAVRVVCVVCVAQELGHLPAVQFSVTRACQENGCSDTLTIYAILCSEGACIESDRFPSPDNNRYSQVVNNNYNTLDLSSTVVESCAIGNNPCSVFVSVYKDCVGVQCEADLFRAAYSTQNGMEILPSTCKFAAWAAMRIVGSHTNPWV